MIPAQPGPAGALEQPPVPAGPISSLGFIQNHTEEAASWSTGYLLNFPRVYRCNSQFRHSQWKLEWYQISFQFLWQPRHRVRRGRVGRELWGPLGWSPHLRAPQAGTCWWPPRLSCCLYSRVLMLSAMWNDFWELCCSPGAGSDGSPQSQVTSVLPLLSSSHQILRSWTPPQSPRNIIPFS